MSDEEKSRIQDLEKKMFYNEKVVHQMEHFKETMDKNNEEVLSKIEHLKTTLMKENEELKQTIKEKDEEIERLKSKIKD